jgi:hypothetical protein
MLNVIMLSDVMLNVIMLSDVMLSVVMLSVVAPYLQVFSVLCFLTIKHHFSWGEATKIWTITGNTAKGTRKQGILAKGEGSIHLTSLCK